MMVPKCALSVKNDTRRGLWCLLWGKAVNLCYFAHKTQNCRAALCIKQRGKSCVIIAMGEKLKTLYAIVSGVIFSYSSWYSTGIASELSVISDTHAS